MAVESVDPEECGLIHSVFPGSFSRPCGIGDTPCDDASVVMANARMRRRWSPRGILFRLVPLMR